MTRSPDSATPYPSDDDRLDDSIRRAVARAVADAPNAPDIAHHAVTPMVASRRRRSASDGVVRWRFAVTAAATAAASVAAVAIIGGEPTSSKLQSAEPSTPMVSAVPSTSVAMSAVSDATAGNDVEVVSSLWPKDLRVVVTNDKGIALVSAVEDSPVGGATGPSWSVAEVIWVDGAPSSVAWEMPDGQIETEWMDVALIATDKLVVVNPQTAEATVTLQRAGSTVDIPRVFSADRLTHGLDIFVGQRTLADSSWEPVLITPDGTEDRQLWIELGVLGPHSPLGDPPRLFSVSPTGSTIGWVRSDRFELADGRSFKIPAGSKVIEADLTDNYVALSRGAGPGQLIDLRTGDAFPVPISTGRVTISLRAPADELAAPPTTTIPLVSDGDAVSQPLPGMVVSGATGVRLYDTTGASVQVTTEPMARALLAPDGSVVMQRRAGWDMGWTEADTIPLVWRPSTGAIEELFPAVSWAADSWLRLHDVMRTADGSWSVLMEVQHTQVNMESEQPQLVIGGVLVDERLAGWEQGVERLSVADNGVVVGAVSGIGQVEFYSVIVPGSALPPPEQAGPPVAWADRVPQCDRCPNMFVIDRAGSMVAWVDADTLAVEDLSTGEQRGYRFSGWATSIDIGDGYALINGSDAVPLLVNLATGEVRPLGTEPGFATLAN
jgi:hypothetical protein